MRLPLSLVEISLNGAMVLNDTQWYSMVISGDDDDIIYLFRMAQLNTVHIKIYTRFLFSEVLIHTIVQSCNIRKYKIK